MAVACWQKTSRTIVKNLTRFAVIGDNPCKPTGNDKTSLMIQLSHRPVRLPIAMLVFKNAGVNLTWIESFPFAQPSQRISVLR